MLVYNTLTNKKEEFKPINPPNVSMYVCGPTIYDYFHIGNGRTFVMSDIIRRYLIFKGYNVKFVMNLTDVDDKIIRKANEEGVSTNELTSRYEKAFMTDIKRFKMKPADVYPKATEHMHEIEDIIEKLENKGIAYNVDGNVFYDVGKFNGYGKLSGKKTDDLELGARVEINDEKKNPLDFSVWKKSKEGEPYWESKWGNGRPGWHIECSAMSMKHLGETIDIHAGGNDLIFPHHENEIAQSEAATGRQFANYWMHFGFLNIDKQKMSKSLGNFFTARDILDQFPAEALRLLFVQSHYRSPLNFSKELIESAQKGSDKLNNLVRLLLKEIDKKEGKLVNYDFNRQYKLFAEAMDDDFNTSQAAAVIFDFTREVNKIIVENDNINSKFYEEAIKFLKDTANDVLGIIDFVQLENEAPNLDEGWILDEIEARLQAKAEKNWKLADEIRNSLFEKGIILEDSKSGTTYKKK
ncbi:MAG: cysteine--tRNA ligase [Bacteroidetes bacterium]|nr:cysteine--tRNA ligase [Bacteroidota bacterium]MBU1113640.1 cysteine--tRNA ligase [Bacteroidota bacterium]MBU1796784.1 cysteine--tRNA ligase [Bacteroidota bacterium]